jgi:hypothetical protein
MGPGSDPALSQVTRLQPTVQGSGLQFDELEFKFGWTSNVALPQFVVASSDLIKRDEAMIGLAATACRCLVHRQSRLVQQASALVGYSS